MRKVPWRALLGWRALVACSGIALAAQISSHVYADARPNCAPSRSARLQQRAQPEWLATAVMQAGYQPETVERTMLGMRREQRVAPWFVMIKQALETLTTATLGSVSVYGAKLLSPQVARPLGQVLVVACGAFALATAALFSYFTLQLEFGDFLPALALYLIAAGTCGAVGGAVAAVPLFHGLARLVGLRWQARRETPATPAGKAPAPGPCIDVVAALQGRSGAAAA